MPDVGAAQRAIVRHRAAGRCEYCLVPQDLTFADHQVDHIIWLKHGGQTVEDNLALCCVPCNKHKGSDMILGMVTDMLQSIQTGGDSDE